MDVDSDRTSWLQLYHQTAQRRRKEHLTLGPKVDLVVHYSIKDKQSSLRKNTTRWWSQLLMRVFADQEQCVVQRIKLPLKVCPT